MVLIELVIIQLIDSQQNIFKFQFLQIFSDSEIVIAWIPQFITTRKCLRIDLFLALLF